MEVAVTIFDLPRKLSFLAWEQSSPKQQRTCFFNFSCFAAVAAGLAALACSATGRSADAQETSTVEARIVAVDIPGASAISFDGIAPRGTVRSLLDEDEDLDDFRGTASNRGSACC